ncbi:hypothetical protein AB0945_09035 [Streptomyces sp. NPDC005474]|uniref:hypothetical protein n=1 Tax=Streptomyces sp. NPDC005474 TaxID=3154878 RepID=UPI0034535D98
MNKSRTTLALALASAASLVAVGSPALAATSSTTATTAPTQCVLVLDEVKAGESASHVSLHKCFSGPGASARAAAAVPRAAAQTELMIWAEDANYGGAYTRIYGNAGTCDGSGYSFNPNSWWSSHLSSFTLEGACNRSFVRGPRGNASFSGQLVGYVGDSLNDAVDYIKIWRG